MTTGQGLVLITHPLVSLELVYIYTQQFPIISANISVRLIKVLHNTSMHNTYIYPVKLNKVILRTEAKIICQFCPISLNISGPRKIKFGIINGVLCYRLAK